MGGDYRSLRAWIKAFELAVEIYAVPGSFPIQERYGITSQLRRAGVSVPLNIAEGQGRNSKKEFLHHLYIALGSLKETETQLLIFESLGYLCHDQVEKLFTKSSEVGRLINGLCRSLRNRADHQSPTTNH